MDIQRMNFPINRFFFFFHGKLILNVAVSATDRQAPISCFPPRPMFKGLKFDSTACSHVCLGRPTGRLQSGGSFWTAAETAW